jgi:hypothetical protein
VTPCFLAISTLETKAAEGSNIEVALFHLEHKNVGSSVKACFYDFGHPCPEKRCDVLTGCNFD